MRVNVFTSVIVGLLAVAYLIWQRGRPREEIDRSDVAEERRIEQSPRRAATREAPARENDHEPPAAS